MRHRVLWLAIAAATIGCSYSEPFERSGHSVVINPDAGVPLEDKAYLCCGERQKPSTACTNATETNGIFSCGADKVLWSCDVKDEKVTSCKQKSESSGTYEPPRPETAGATHTWCCPSGTNPGRSTQGCQKPTPSGQTPAGFTIYSCGSDIMWECDLHDDGSSTCAQT